MCNTKILIVALVLISATRCYASDEELLRKVISMYGASRRAITSLDCTYQFRTGTMGKEARYVEDGEQRYQASVTVGRRFLSSPDEVSWDGHTARHRVSVDTFNFSRDRTNYHIGCPPPDGLLTVYVHPALGFGDPGTQSYKFKSARQLAYNGLDCIELVFDAPFTGGELTIYHAADFGYWPVYVKLTGTNKIVYETRDVRYAKRVVAGNAVFYPAHLAAVVTPREPTENLETCDIEEDKLHINEPVDANLFTFAPWPSQRVWNKDSDRVDPPADPNWKPEGQVGFPWEQFLTGKQPAHQPDSPRVKVASAKRTNIDVAQWTAIGLTVFASACVVGGLVWRHQHGKRR